MRVEQSEAIPGVLLARPDVHADPRGSFAEIVREDVLGACFVQANHSHSHAGVLRGLHYHRQQADAWYVISGRVQVGLADLRQRLPCPAVATLEISASEPALLFIPPGVAHGYLALGDLDLVYWVTEYHNGSDEHGVAWDDPTLAVPWVVRDPILSDRDAHAPKLDWDGVSATLVPLGGGG